MSPVSKKLKKKLTVAENRLNQSGECQNCGTELQGPYCHYCGQPDKNFFRFFPALLREMMGDLLDLDSRLTRTLKPLLFQPGKLADDYMHGRRFRYTSPVRLYLFSSIIFFLLAGFITNFEIQRGLESHNTVTHENVSTAPQTDSPHKHSGIHTEITESGTPTKPPVEDETEPPTARGGDSFFKIDLNSDSGSHDIDSINLPLVPQMLNDWINVELAKSDAKNAAIEADPTIISDKIFEILPITVFVLLPAFALILKGFYIRSKRYYTEHLIFALYNHSFLFVLATAMFLLESGGSLLASQGWISKSGWLFAIFDWPSQLMKIWMLVYFWLGLKRFYRQGWLMTSVKFVSIGIAYTILLATITVFVAMLSFLLL
ncbi:MAG: DUF3667 domain-containing protein [Xanthomonadales bacterium]|nr:DUF3667 domain-containing protein [Xanthomonadales bacterium]